VKIQYTVGKRSGQSEEVDTATGEWLIDKRRAVAVQEAPTEAPSEPRVKRKYTRRAPTTPAPAEGGSEASTEGTEDAE